MNVTQYRGYNLVLRTGAVDIEIWHGTKPLSSASDIAGAQRIIDGWLNAQ
jgi:hypothetical protein